MGFLLDRLIGDAERLHPGLRVQVIAAYAGSCDVSYLATEYTRIVVKALWNLPSRLETPSRPAGNGDRHLL